MVRKGESQTDSRVSDLVGRGHRPLIYLMFACGEMQDLRKPGTVPKPSNYWVVISSAHLPQGLPHIRGQQGTYRQDRACCMPNTEEGKVEGGKWGSGYQGDVSISKEHRLPWQPILHRMDVVSPSSGTGCQAMKAGTVYWEVMANDCIDVFTIIS